MTGPEPYICEARQIQRCAQQSERRRYAIKI